MTRLGSFANFHLVSDSTGETLAGVLRAPCAAFGHSLPVEHSYFRGRSARELERVTAGTGAAPGVVISTLSSLAQRAQLKEACRKRNMPRVAVLDPVLDMTSRYLGVELN